MGAEDVASETVGSASPVSGAYFADAADNVLILRYIIGEIEELFMYGDQQKEDLMNQSIMYEPSQQATPKIVRSLAAPPEMMDAAQSEQRGVRRGGRIKAWSRPKGEWEVDLWLRLNRWVVRVVLNKWPSEEVPASAWYEENVTEVHRTYCTDMRVIAWALLLIVTRVTWWLDGFVFYLVMMLFITAVVVTTCGRGRLAH